MQRGRTGSTLKIKWCNASVHRGPGEPNVQQLERDFCPILAFCLALLTGVFPFDVGQVGRAGVADGKALLGHTLIPIHVHEVRRHGDLKETRQRRQ